VAGRSVSNTTGRPRNTAPRQYRAAAVARQQAPLNNDGDMTVTRKVYEAYFSPVERTILEARQQAESESVAKARAHVRRGAYAKHERR
jgi:hypothetical protein